MTITATKPRKQPKQWRSRDTVESILEGAAQVFDRHGYAAGTTNRIAERAGVSIGSVYQYFPNKDSILVALIERHMEQAEAVLVPLGARLIERREPLATGLADLVAAMAALHREQPNLHRVLFEEAPRPKSLKRKLDAAQAQATAAVTVYLGTSDEVTLHDIETAAQLVVTVVESVTHNIALDMPDDEAWNVTAAHTVEMLHAYLTRPIDERIAPTPLDVGQS
jgi:AcrR family transcriptional regulator